MIEQTEGGFDNFTKGYTKLGFNLQHNNDILYREWAPNAVTANLIGDFSQSSQPTRKVGRTAAPSRLASLTGHHGRAQMAGTERLTR